jgi:curved DNA-binding protein CbpA
MSDDTYYTVLGVSETATELEIKTAYRNLVKKIHPDTVSTLSQELRFLAEGATKDITEAYSVLSDADKRREYDRKCVLGEHRLKSVRPPVARDVPPGPHVRPQRSHSIRGHQRQQQVDDDEDDWYHLRLWAVRHPEIASILAVGWLPLLVILFLLIVAH